MVTTDLPILPIERICEGKLEAAENVGSYLQFFSLARMNEVECEYETLFSSLSLCPVFVFVYEARGLAMRFFSLHAERPSPSVENWLWTCVLYCHVLGLCVEKGRGNKFRFRPINAEREWHFYCSSRLFFADRRYCIKYHIPISDRIGIKKRGRPPIDSCPTIVVSRSKIIANFSIISSSIASQKTAVILGRTTSTGSTTEGHSKVTAASSSGSPTRRSARLAITPASPSTLWARPSTCTTGTKVRRKYN